MGIYFDIDDQHPSLPLVFYLENIQANDRKLLLREYKLIENSQFNL